MRIKKLKAWVDAHDRGNEGLVSSGVRGVVKKAFPRMNVYGYDHFSTIFCYWTHWDYVIKNTKVDRKPYVSEFYDCDDFANSFKAQMSLIGMNSCGKVIDYSGGHAYNVLAILDINLYQKTRKANPKATTCLSSYITVKIFEPQSDSFPKPFQGQYKLQDGDIYL